MTVGTSHPRPRWAQDVTRELVWNALGTAALGMRHGPRDFLRTLAPSRAGVAALSQVKGGAMASAAIAVAGVTARNLREKRNSTRQWAREIANEGMAEALCGGTSALVASATGLATSKALAAAGITGLKGSILLVGLPLTSAVITTVVMRHAYDHSIGTRLQPADPGGECIA